MTIVGILIGAFILIRVCLSYKRINKRRRQLVRRGFGLAALGALDIIVMSAAVLLHVPFWLFNLPFYDRVLIYVVPILIVLKLTHIEVKKLRRMRIEIESAKHSSGQE